ncbi:MAG: histidine triad nucleotide-binding protein [Elusimicrobiota bacterium]
MDCIFCKISKGTIKSDCVYEDEEIFAFRDINPQAPVHILIIPKKHIESISQIKGDEESLAGRILSISLEIAKKEKIDKSGFRIVVNNGPDAGQAVNHLHFHLLGGRELHWPPG